MGYASGFRGNIGKAMPETAASFAVVAAVLLAAAVLVAGCVTGPAQDAGMPSAGSGSPSSSTSSSQGSSSPSSSSPSSSSLSSSSPSSSSSSSPTSSTAGQAPMKEIKVEAYSFGWNSSTTTVSQGDRVRLVLTSTSGTHGPTLPDYGVATQSFSPGDAPVVVEFTADRQGRFAFFCNRPCGSGHSLMRGTLAVN